MNPSESRSQESGVRNRILPLLLGITLLGTLAVGVSVLATGCGKPPKPPKSDDPTGSTKGDPWEAAAKKLRKSTDLLTCKGAINGLNSELAASQTVAKPAAMTREA